MKAPQFAVGGRSPDGAPRRRRSAGRKTALRADESYRRYEREHWRGRTSRGSRHNRHRVLSPSVITGAEDFLPALEGGTNWKPPRARACPFVGAWALECALKSHLRQRGCPTRIEKYGHDLQRLCGRLLNWICQCQVSRRTGVYSSIHYRSAVPSKVSRELQRIHRDAKK